MYCVLRQQFYHEIKYQMLTDRDTNKIKLNKILKCLDMKHIEKRNLINVLWIYGLCRFHYNTTRLMTVEAPSSVTNGFCQLLIVWMESKNFNIKFINTPGE